MRWLWALLAILGVAAALLWMRAPSEPTPLPSPVPARAEPERVPHGTPPEPRPAPDTAEPTPEPPQLEIVDLSAAVHEALKTPEPEPLEIRPPLREDVTPSPDPLEEHIAEATRALDELLNQQRLEGSAPAPKPEPTPPVTEVTPDAPPVAEPADETPLPAKVEKRDDGTMLIDDRFVVRGAGTAESPFVVPWELLVAAQQAYAPRLGKKRLPESVTMFDGKVVEVTGYVAFPMLQDTSDELLAMLNIWDGCCIGIPPTPYDAIEVKLAKRAEGDERFARYGTLRGTFGVKPHLVGQWLVGLYVMDHATLDTKEFGGFGS